MFSKFSAVVVVEYEVENYSKFFTPGWMHGGGSKGTEFSQVPEREYSFSIFLPSFLMR